MERAFKANPNMPSLLINHRARGGLHKLASSMFYGGKMKPAVDPKAPGAVPQSTEHLRKTYIMPLKSSQKKQVSRMLTVLEGLEFDREESRIQGSLFNEAHQDWVERLVKRLIKDPEFLQTNGKNRGTILIMSPYKRAVIEYGKMINILRRGIPPNLNGCIVEARTVDTAQGHEADVVILDFVSDWYAQPLISSPPHPLSRL
jgi:superfamily I DNA and/or RNA helicase